MTNADKYLDLTKRSAQNLSEKENLIFRLIRIDQEKFLEYPEDFRTDRVCIEIDNGKVTKANIQ